jgi:hypothetical protein
MLIQLVVNIGRFLQTAELAQQLYLMQPRKNAVPTGLGLGYQLSSAKTR